MDQEETIMVDSPRRTISDYYKRTDNGKISLRFQLANLVSFDIKNIVIACLNDNEFDGNAIIDPWEHLTRFYEIWSV